MTESPALSVAMPVHNGMPYIDESIRSLLSQSFTDFELIIGDDGSTDGTADAILRWADRDARIRVSRIGQSLGVAASHNRVASLARAPLIAIAHADDLSHPDRLRRQLEVFGARPDAIAVGALSVGVDCHGRPVQPANCWRLTRASSAAPFAHSTIMFRSRAFETVGGYRPGTNYWEDLDLYWRLMELGPILTIPEELSIYRHSSSSCRTRGDVEAVENALDLRYRAAALFQRGEDYYPLLNAEPRARGERIHPRVFVARSWTSVWHGERPGTLRRLLQRGRFGADFQSCLALSFVIAATISPQLLRLLVKSWTHACNLAGRYALRGLDAVEWKTKARAQADRPVSAFRRVRSRLSG